MNVVSLNKKEIELEFLLPILEDQEYKNLVAAINSFSFQLVDKMKSLNENLIKSNHPHLLGDSETLESIWNGKPITHSGKFIEDEVRHTTIF